MNAWGRALMLVAVDLARVHGRQAAMQWFARLSRADRAALEKAWRASRAGGGREAR